MAGNGLNMKDINEIKRLWKLGLKKPEISRTTKVHRNTVSRHIDQFISEKNSVQPIPTLPAVANWIADIDWKKVRSEYLGGVSLNLIHHPQLSEISRNHIDATTQIDNLPYKDFSGIGGINLVKRAKLETTWRPSQ